MVRLLHTADWQIGKQFAQIKGDAAAHLRSRRIETVEKIGELATAQKVDAVLVAGDVFDSHGVAGVNIIKTFSAMADSFEGKWLLLPGNHDAAEPGGIWTRVKKHFVSQRIHVLDEPVPFYLEEAKTVILPAPLTRRHDARDLTQWFDHAACQSENELIKVGLAHGSIDNRLQHDSGEAFNRISDRRAQSANLNYLALGDWHGTLKIAERTWYSGTPEPDRFKANDAGNVLVVEIAHAQAEPKVEKMGIGHYKWCQIEHSVFEAQDLNAVEQKLITMGGALDRTLLQLNLKGTVSLETRNKLNQALEVLSAKLFYLETDDSGLMARPDENELKQMGNTGFVHAAVQQLLAMSKDANNADSETANLALQILYLEHKELVH